jgi:uncharacterized Zn finger protein
MKGRSAVADADARLRRKLAAELAPYRGILQALVSGEMEPGEFEERYFAMYEADERWTPREVYKIVEEFFFVVEDYVDDPRLRDLAQGDLGPDELKQRARELLLRAGFEAPTER